MESLTKTICSPEVSFSCKFLCMEDSHLHLKFSGNHNDANKGGTRRSAHLVATYIALQKDQLPIQKCFGHVDSQGAKERNWLW